MSINTYHNFYKDVNRMTPLQIQRGTSKLMSLCEEEDKKLRKHKKKRILTSTQKQGMEHARNKQHFKTI